MYIEFARRGIPIVSGLRKVAVFVFACFFCATFYLGYHAPRSADATKGAVSPVRIHATIIYVNPLEAWLIQYGPGCCIAVSFVTIILENFFRRKIDSNCSSYFSFRK